jgi:catechol 2,3-dioxygenase-like lactoylglutathione lyase family enzyme
MLQADDVIAFAASADLRQARAFYEQVLGLRVIEQNDFACVFDANGTMFRVTAVAEVARPGYTVLGWRVADIAATVRGLTERGVVFLRYDGMGQDENGVWTTPGGDKVAWFADPDGNVLSLTQFG